MTTQALFEELEGAEKKWLALSEYSNKYKMSISTLRRRIKANQIPFQLKGGKYYIANIFPIKYALTPTPPSEKRLEATTHRPSKSQVAGGFSELGEPPSSFASPSHLLEEMQKILLRMEETSKKSLLEKDKQILALQLEISNLKTLIKVLEERLFYLEPL